MEIGYQTSKRYEDLWQMVTEGIEVIAYVKCKKNNEGYSGKICTITKSEDYIRARSEDTLYFAYCEAYGRNGFITKCSYYNVEFIPPNIGV